MPLAQQWPPLYGPRLVLLALLAGACAGDALAPRESVNVSGTWQGALTLEIAGVTSTHTFVFMLSQTRATLSGSWQIGEVPGPVQGTVEGKDVTLVASVYPIVFDDCHRYTQTYRFVVVTSDELRLSSVSGQVCDGDGQGGHTALHTVSGGRGSIRKQ